MRSTFEGPLNKPEKWNAKARHNNRKDRANWVKK